MQKLSGRTAFLAVLLFISGNAFPQQVNYWSALVKAENSWSYFTGTKEPPTDWLSVDFNDAAWLQGPGGIGYGDGDDATVVGQVTSLYMRHSFQVSDPASMLSALLYVDYDDGFVAYLNGTEIARANMGSDFRPPFNQFAANCDAEAQRPSGGLPACFILRAGQLTSLRAGTNVLAIQVHNCNASSSDLSSTTYLLGGFTSDPGNIQSLPSWMPDPAKQNSHLPLILIDTHGQTIPDEPKITVDFKVIDNGAGNLNSLYDIPNQFDGLAGIEVRGQSSQMFEKKSFGLELRNPLGDEVQTELLGMPAESDWILYAPYSDKTMLRNALTFHLGGKMGRYQPRFRFCEVYLNGSYHGVYQLTERIKRDNDRVDIEKMEPGDVEGDAVTGGYIVKVDKPYDLPASDFFTSYPDITFPNSRAYTWSWYYPKAEDLDQLQKNWFAAFIKTAENALNSATFINQETGYAKYFDTGSFVDFQIMNELANNVDGYRYSTFFYKDRDSKGGKLVAGPLWDFDLCYGNVDYAPDRLSTSKWLYPTYGTGEGNCMHWWYRLMQDPRYASAVKQRYSLLRRGILHTDSIMKYIDSQATYFGDAAGRNFSRWNILDQYVWPNSAIRYSYEAEITFLKNWVTSRLNWMDTQWLVPVTSTREPALASLTAYPNPFRDIVYITLPPEAGNMTIEIYDIRGMRVFSGTNLPAAAGLAEVNLSRLQDGIYLYRISGEGRQPVTGKIVKTGQ